MAVRRHVSGIYMTYICVIRYTLKDISLNMRYIDHDI